MPAVSEKQRRFMAMILSAKRKGKTSDLSDAARKVSQGLSSKKLRKFAVKSGSKHGSKHGSRHGREKK